MLLVLFLSRALLSDAPAAGTATLIVRENDKASIAVAQCLPSYAPEYTFWAPRPENIDAAGAKLHLMPYYLLEGDKRQKLDDEVMDLIAAAQRKPASEQPAAIRGALVLAFHLPIQPPDPRNQKVLFAQRRLIDAYLKINDDSHATQMVEEYVTRLAPDASLDLNSREAPIAARLRRQARTELSVEVASSGEAQVSLDGQDFEAPRAQKVLPGVHEIAVRFGQKMTGLLHRIEVSGKTLRYVIDPALDRALAFTPYGFVLRGNENLTPAVVALVADGTNAESVWLVEKKSDEPPALLLTIAQKGKLYVAQVNLPDDAPLLPGNDIEGRQKLARAVVAASEVALSEQPLVLADYDVTRAPDGLLTLVPRKAGVSGPLYKKWWLWTAVGAVAAGVVTASVLVATHQSGVIVTSTFTSAR